MWPRVAGVRAERNVSFYAYLAVGPWWLLAFHVVVFGERSKE